MISVLEHLRACIQRTSASCVGAPRQLHVSEGCRANSVLGERGLVGDCTRVDTDAREDDPRNDDVHLAAANVSNQNRTRISRDHLKLDMDSELCQTLRRDREGMLRVAFQKFMSMRGTWRVPGRLKR